MAWKVYDAMEGQDGNPRFQTRGATVYGPLPCKRWIPDIPHKKHKLSYKFSFKRSVEDANDYNSRRATEYAKWLAQRDGIDISDRSACPIHDYAHNIGKRRIRGVNFSKRNAELIFIAIPHWDWEPAEPVEEIIGETVDMLLAA